MNTLIATLLECPNLSLRVLDSQGRAITTLSREQLQHYVDQNHTACRPTCSQANCIQHPGQAN